jgi:putative endonuclease
MAHEYFVYIMTNDRRTVFYTGVTSDLMRRVSEHWPRTIRGFTSRNNLDNPVFFGRSNEVLAAIAHEKQIKSGSRHRKIALIASMNPNWRDLYDDLL